MARYNPKFFDATYYLTQNADVAANWVGAAEDHFFSYGAAEGRKPAAWFDAQYIRAKYADLANMNAEQLFAHYNQYGFNEGRVTAAAYQNFNAAKYLADNADLGAAGITAASALNHYLTYGQVEGRAAFNVDGTAISTTTNQGQTFTLTADIDNFTGTSGNDSFLGDNTSANAGDTLVGGAGTDTLKLYNSVNLGNISGIENVYINGNTGDVNVSSKADVQLLTIADVAQTVAGQDYTVAAGQVLELNNVQDTAGTGAGVAVEVQAAASVTAQTVKLNKAGDAETGGNDLFIDINGAGVKTLTLDSSSNASRVSIVNTGAAITGLNVTGDAALAIDTNVPGATAIAITNTAGATLSTAVAPDATTGLTITAVGGADSVTLAQAAGAAALTNKVAVDLGAGNDTLKITNLTAATDIADGASFKGGEGTDTLNIVTGAVLDATRGKLFSSFEAVDLAGATGTFNLALLADNNTVTSLKVSAATSAAVTVNNLAEAASVTVGAAINAGGLAINQKDAGAGSPDDVLNVTFDSRTALTTTGGIDINDVETVNVSATSAGTNITHTVTTLAADEATKVTVNASTAGVILDGVSMASLVLFDASASVKAVRVDAADAYAATAGVAFKGGSAADTIDLTGATTAAAGATDLDFVVTGNGGADAITLAAAAGRDDVVYLAQGDSTATDFDSITNFLTTVDKINLKAFGFSGASDDAVVTVGSGVSVNASGDVEVTSAAAGNFFNDAGIDRAVAEAVVGTDLFVFVDVNKDGDFSAANDLVVKLVGLGAAGFAVGDVVFA